MGVKAVGGALSRSAMQKFAGILLLAGLGISVAGPAHACPCERNSPTAGFDRAQYVFTGEVVEARPHTWVVEVEHVWKGGDKLARSVRLMDV